MFSKCPSSRHKNNLEWNEVLNWFHLELFICQWIEVGEWFNILQTRFLMRSLCLDFPWWCLSVLPSQKSLIYGWKLRKNLPLPILKWIFEFQSKVCTSLQLIHLKNRWVYAQFDLFRQIWSKNWVAWNLLRL